MKAKMLWPYHAIFDNYKPSTICEIGTHDGKSAVQFIDYCIKHNAKLHYIGYDIFDDVKNDNEFHKKEINGKGAGRYKTAKSNLLHRQNKFKKFKFKLIKGYTTDTLVESKYDFVYIDGGHSYETVKHDYYKLKNSKVIVFDDYQTDGVKKFFDEMVKQDNIPFVNWENAFNSTKPIWTFLPHQKSLHIQPVIFNA